MHHIIAQAPCMVTDGGEWAADYVVRTERLQEDMQAVRRLALGWCWAGAGGGCSRRCLQALVAAALGGCRWLQAAAVARAALRAHTCSILHPTPRSARQVLQEMNARRHLGVPEIDVPATLAGLTNVNKVHVACKGPTPGTAAADQSRCGRIKLQSAGWWRFQRWAATAAAAAAAAGAAAAAAVMAALAARRVGARAAPTPSLPSHALAPRPCSRRQLLARPLHLEAPESYCSEAQYFLQPHSACFDALRSYYSHDMRLFGLPSCLDGAAAAADAAAAGVSAAQAAAAADDDDDAAAAAAEAEAAAVAGGEAEFAVEVADAQDDSALLSEAEAAGALLDAAEAEDAAVADE